MSQYGLIFAPGITLNEVNPENFHMKNEYCDNLICTSLSILPVIGSMVKEIKILKGFISLQKYNNEMKDESKTAQDKKFCKGLGLQFTWNNYSCDTARTVMKKLIAALPNEKLNIIIDEQSVVILRKVIKPKMVQKVGNIYRVLA